MIIFVAKSKKYKPKTKNTMKNILRYFVMTIILMIMGIMPGNAMVVFDATTDRISGKNSITKDGITISTTDGNTWTSVFSGELLITSSHGNILMVGFKRPDGFDVASNSFEFDQNHQKSSPQQQRRVQTDNSGSWEDWSYRDIGYKVWKGVSSELIYPYLYYNDRIEKIYVYLEGDELPQKSPYAMYEHVYSYSYDCYCPTETVEKKLTICYGYSDFIPTEYEPILYDDYYHGSYYETLKKISFPFDGNDLIWANEPFDLITFDDSFSEYKPKSTSEWFKGTSFKYISLDNIDLSEVTDMSYMFQNCKANKIDIRGISFSSHPKVTGMFSGSTINYFKINEKIKEAGDDIFVDVGAENNPCYLESPISISQTNDVNDDVYYYKGGYFLRPHNKGYAMSSGYYKKENYDTSEFLPYSASRSIEFRYDSLYKEKYHYRSLFDRVGEDFIFLDGGTYGFIDECWEDISVFDLNNPSWTSHGIKAYYYGSLGICPSSLSIKFDPSFTNARPTTTKAWFDFGVKEYKDQICPNPANSYYFGQEQVPYKVPNVSMSSEQEDCIGLSIDGLCYLNTSEVTDMSYMFGGSYYFGNNLDDNYFYSFHYNNITSLDLSNFDTSKVINSDYMLSGCKNLEELHVSPTMSNLSENACYGIGGEWFNEKLPCKLYAPKGFDYGVGVLTKNIEWKGGYFSLENVDTLC